MASTHVLAVCLFALLAGCTPSDTGIRSSVVPTASAAPSVADETLAVPVIDADGRTTALQARVCRPTGRGLARLVVIAHGTTSSAATRPRAPLGGCGQETAQWFLSRGYAVAFALRRGYGATGGAWAEDYGRCADPDFAHAGQETARDIDAVVDRVTALPGIKPNGAVVVGHSAGGWGTIAADSLPHPKVSAFVSMAGGRGGRQHDMPNENCRPDRLAEVAGRFGATASTPMLWIYAANDSFFAPPIAEAMRAHFTAAGGQAELMQVGPYGLEGHRLFIGQGGSKVWGPLVQRYLVQQGAYPP